MKIAVIPMAVLWVILVILPLYANSQVTEAGAPSVSLAPMTTPTPTLTPASPPAGDNFEPDDVCDQAQAISTDGVPQMHTFHRYADNDWGVFQAIAGITYDIEVRVPVTSSADILLELYDRCGAATSQSLGISSNLGPGVRIRWKSEETEPLFVRILNQEPIIYGPDVAYDISVHYLQPSSGALIVVAGRARDPDPLQLNIHNAANAVFKRFWELGYPRDRIRYLATDLTLNPIGGLMGVVDVPPTTAGLRYAITEWARDKVGGERYLTIYLINHGNTELFYLDKLNDQSIKPQDLNAWLDELETAVPGVKVNLIIEASCAGGFIDLPQSTSKSGRVVITSSSATGNAYASQNGALFTDAFTARLTIGTSLWTAFMSARTMVQVASPSQEPWLDDNGNAIPNEASDGQEAASRILFTEFAPPTPTPTSSNTPSPTPTKTPTPTYTPTPTPTPSRDPYEPDDTCDRANTLPADGMFQQHTFHVTGDTDWVRFNATGGTRYVIAATQVGSQADVDVTLYDACDGASLGHSDSFGPDTTMLWTAPENGLYYLRAINMAQGTGSDTNYRLSIRAVSSGAAIIVGGRMKAPEEFQNQITYMTERAYHAFRSAGYDHDDLYYLSADPKAPTYVDAPSVPANLAYAIQTWAPTHLSDGAPLYLYLADHGVKEGFYLDVQTTFSPDQLDAWLRSFENQRPNSPVVVILEACKSGSFITPVGSISRTGRIIITSADDATDAIPKQAGQGGGYFSDPFFDALAANYDLWTSFQMARQAARLYQSPWLDGNGNGVPFPRDPADEGAGRSLGLGHVPGLAGQPPYIERPTLPAPNDTAPVLIQVTMLDEDLPAATAWIEVTKPSTAPPSPPPGYDTPISHAERVDLTYNPVTDRFETPFTFDEIGAYQFMFQAQDVEGQRAQPVIMNIRTGSVTYLPLLLVP